MWNITPDVFLSRKEECLSYIKEHWEKIPQLGCDLSCNITEGQLVRFIGMIQDMPNPVFYLSQFEVQNNNTGVKEVRSGKYREILSWNEDETPLLNTKNCHHDERQLYCCISVPGLNTWAKPIVTTKLETQGSGSSSDESSGSKRNVEEMEVDEETNSTKRQCINPPTASATEQMPNSSFKNFPISSSDNFSCIVHVYDSATGGKDVKVNDIVEVCGFVYFISVHENDLDSDIDEPPIKLPRLHGITFTINNSFIPLRNLETKNDELISKARSLRSELHLILTQILLGDSLAADYLICHFLSHVYSRKDFTVLGKFSLNVSNVCDSEYINELYNVISKLLPKSHYFPMSIDNMNTLDFVPKKDYELNRLQSGMLQLSDHTHLVIDETKLAVGTLRDKGVRNVEALKYLLQNQKLNYDFKYYTIEFLHDTQILILSEGKTFLNCDCHIPLEPQPEFTSSLKDVYSAVNKYLQGDLLDQLRNYISVMASIRDFTLPDNLEDTVTNDLVDQRVVGEKSAADDYHTRLVLARLLSLSYGEKVLMKSTWDRSGTMEIDRKLRLNLK